MIESYLVFGDLIDGELIANHPPPWGRAPNEIMGEWMAGMHDARPTAVLAYCIASLHL